MVRKKKLMLPKEEIAEDFCFVCKDGGLLQICDYRDCLKAYHPLCVGNDPSVLETETEWNCRWHSCFICHKGSSYRCLCCPISVCGRCIKHDAAFVPIKKKKTGLCNNCLKLAIMIEENADVDSDGGKVDFQDRATSEYLFKDYWEIVNEKEGLTLEDLHAADSRLKRNQVFESGSESDADEVLEEEMLTEVDDVCLRDLFGGMKTPTKRYRARKKSYLAWSSDESLEEVENSKKHQRIISDSGLKSEQNHCKKKVPEQPKNEYAAIVEKNINSIYLRKSLALKLLGDPETFEHKVTGCFVRVKVDPKDFYSLPYKLYQLGLVKCVKKVQHAYQAGKVSTDVVLCIPNMKDVRISMLSDEDIEEEDCEDLRQMVKKGTFKMPSIAELDKKIRSMHRDIMSHWIGRELSRLEKKIERANEKGWRAELLVLIDERQLLRTPKEQNRLLDEIPSVITEMEDLPAPALEITSMEIDGNISAPVEKVAQGNISAPVEKVAQDMHAAALETISVAALETISVEIEGNTSASVEKVGVEVAEGGVNATSMKVPVQEVEDGHATAGEAFLLDIEVLAVQTDTKQHNPLEVIDSNRFDVQSESDKKLKSLDAVKPLDDEVISSSRSSIKSGFKEKLLDAHGKLLDAHGTNNILSVKSESAARHKALDNEMNSSSRSSIKRKSDMKQHKPLEVIDSSGFNVQSDSDKKLKSLDADKPLDDEVISSSRSSIQSEFKEKLLDVHGTNNILNVESESAKQHKLLDTEMNSSSSLGIKRKSDGHAAACEAFLPDVDGLSMQTDTKQNQPLEVIDSNGLSVKNDSEKQLMSLDADVISNRSSIQNEIKDGLLVVLGTNNRMDVKTESAKQCKPLDAEVISSSRSSIKSEFLEKLLDSHGTNNRLGFKSELAKHHKPLDTEMNGSSGSSIKRKSDSNGSSVKGDFGKKRKSLNADAINSNRSSITGEIKEKLLDAHRINKPSNVEVIDTSRLSIKSKSKQKLLDLHVKTESAKPAEANRVSRNRSSVKSKSADRRPMDKISSGDIIFLDDDSDDPETLKICLNGDDKDDAGAECYTYPETQRVWFYNDPFGGVQGPFTKGELRHWNDQRYFTANFKVWSLGQSPDASVLLADVLRH